MKAVLLDKTGTLTEGRCEARLAPHQCTHCLQAELSSKSDPPVPGCHKMLSYPLPNHYQINGPGEEQVLQYAPLPRVRHHQIQDLILYQHSNTLSSWCHDLALSNSTQSYDSNPNTPQPKVQSVLGRRVDTDRLLDDPGQLIAQVVAWEECGGWPRKAALVLAAAAERGSSHPIAAAIAGAAAAAASGDDGAAPEVAKTCTMAGQVLCPQLPWARPRR